jgi:hypothetical protein
VNDPYGAQHKEADLPLLLGSFVTAVLPGRNAGAVYRISRTALRDHAPDAAAAKQPAFEGLSSWVVLAGSTVEPDSVKLEPGNTNRGAPVNPTLKAGDHELARLSYRRVRVLRYEGRDALINAGLKDGDRVALTALDVITEGMLARLAKPEEAAARTAAASPTPSGGSAK